MSSTGALDYAETQWRARRSSFARVIHPASKSSARCLDVNEQQIPSPSAFIPRTAETVATRNRTGDSVPLLTWSLD